MGGRGYACRTRQYGKWVPKLAMFQSEAIEWAAELSRRSGQYVQAYACAECAWWHVGRSSRGFKSGLSRADDVI